MKPYKNINPQRSFVTEYVEKHSQKNHFFNEVKSLIDWEVINNDLKKVYTKGLAEKGAKAYSPLLLFKMILISEWYGLSDTQTESMVNDSLSAIKFCDLTIEGNVPGHSTLSKFKKELKDHKVFDQLLKQVKNQLSKHQLKVKKGKALVVAKLTSI